MILKINRQKPDQPVAETVAMDSTSTTPTNTIQTQTATKQAEQPEPIKEFVAAMTSAENKTVDYLNNELVEHLGTATSKKQSTKCRSLPTFQALSLTQVLAIPTFSGHTFNSKLLADYEALAKDTAGFQGICAKTGRKFWQVAGEEILLMLAAGNSREQVMYWLESELCKRVAPEWILTSPKQLDFLADNDPAGYLVYMLTLANKANDTYHNRRIASNAYEQLNRYDVSEISKLTEKLRRILSWVSHENLTKHGKFSIYNFFNMYLLNSQPFLANVFCDKLSAKLDEALKTVIKYCQKVKILQENPTDTDLLELREKMEGYRNLHEQRKGQVANWRKDAITQLAFMELTDSLSDLDINFSKTELIHRAVSDIKPKVSKQEAKTKPYSGKKLTFNKPVTLKIRKADNND